jgi:hypothetical protein
MLPLLVYSFDRATGWQKVEKSLGKSAGTATKIGPALLFAGINSFADERLGVGLIHLITILKKKILNY